MNAVQPFIGVNKMRVKNITVTVLVRVSVTLGSVLFDLLAVIVWWH